ncbi:hypothetical protein ACFFV7_47260 [Nonomuraea spiralis]|uniref:Uncharacterized protein n=1 Tax=Nonomuraea spiralis TaxID=46182 RepID=A0ABV5IWB1_9ACTN|nr:hypothetical protein [Nonomuraea spiralis]GGS85568.1 hypothetical protein GCM10010176_031640 [Nonomuraea spiralis]
MTMLTYTVITDPAPLEASASGRPSTGTVYLVITNTGQQTAYWSTITVEVPVGNGARDLTSDFNKIKHKGEHNGTPSVNLQPQGTNAFQATPLNGTAFAPGDYMVLTLENVIVAAERGLAVLKVTEKAGRTKTGRPSTSSAAVALVKTAPKEIPAPHSFLADSAVVDAGSKVTLSWEGSDDFTYEIRFPGGPKPVPTVSRTGSYGPYSLVLDTADAPKRDTTYTLVASFGTQRHTFTTTVQVRNPVLETLTAINGVTTPWVQGRATGDGAVTFSKGAMHIRREFASNDPGALFADKADLNGVNTEWVQGRSTDDGRITFPRFGLQVYQGGTNTTSGVVYADSVRAKDAPYGHGGGWINLHDEGMTVYLSKDGSNGLGSVTARDFNR